MRYSRALIPSLREVPKDAVTPSHILLLRAGYMRMAGAGIYELLPLGLRVLHKIEAIIREEMNAAGAQELLMPALLPAEYFRETGRFDSFGDALFRLRDRRGNDYHLGPTHEEIITDLVRRDVRSYKQLPLNLYQIQMKFRDEPRPRAGLLRGREFLMKDAYSFDVDEDAARKSYEIMRETYRRIFDRIGLEYRIVAADSGAMGGSTSAEFQVLTQTGEDRLVACEKCDYAANVEVAEVRAEAIEPGSAPLKEVETPDKRSIEEVAEFLGVKPEETIKSLLFVADGETVMAIVRGDHEANEIAIARLAGANEIRLATEDEITEATGAPVGFAGPVGFKGKIFVDRDAAAVKDAVAGANQLDRHVTGVNFDRDYQGELGSIRFAEEGDGCPRCEGTLRSYRGIEGGHIFILGTHYSENMGATFLDPDGKAKPFVMGCYGIGVSRLLATAIEQNHDEDGIRWPVSIAPFSIVLAPIGKNAEVLAAAEALYEELVAAGLEVLYDDRDERPGVKFKDADLLGIPFRLVVGGRGLEKGVVEFKARDSKETEEIARDGIVEELKRRIENAKS
ncbi:MAG: proline--tRNA ligase [Sandaracinaceae bacterium]|nr:proline--tRNA ligase [Sandaracinaceae bacterium]